MPGQPRQDEPADGVLRVTLSHPATRGALDRAVLLDLRSASASNPVREGVRASAERRPARWRGT